MASWFLLLLEDYSRWCSGAWWYFLFVHFISFKLTIPIIVGQANQIISILYTHTFMFVYTFTCDKRTNEEINGQSIQNIFKNTEKETR